MENAMFSMFMPCSSSPSGDEHRSGDEASTSQVLPTNRQRVGERDGADHLSWPLDGTNNATTLILVLASWTVE